MSAFANVLHELSLRKPKVRPIPPTKSNAGSRLPEHVCSPYERERGTVCRSIAVMSDLRRLTGNKQTLVNAGRHLTRDGTTTGGCPEVSPIRKIK